MAAFDLFKMMVIASFFWSFFITTLITVIPTNYLTQVDLFSGTARDMNTMAQELETGLSHQQSVPVVEFGALVYYSGTYLVDLMVNFLGALPQMVAMLVAGIFTLVPINVDLKRNIIIVVELTAFALYIINFVALIANMRSSGGNLQ